MRITTNDIANSVAPARKSDVLVGRKEEQRKQTAREMFARGNSEDSIIEFLFRGIQSQEEINRVKSREELQALPKAFLQANALPSEIMQLRRNAAVKWLRDVLRNV